jgi:hypothetical protein
MPYLWQKKITGAGDALPPGRKKWTCPIFHKGLMKVSSTTGYDPLAPSPEAMGGTKHDESDLAAKQTVVVSAHVVTIIPPKSNILDFAVFIVSVIGNRF